MKGENGRIYKMTMQEVMLVFPAGELITVEQVIRDLTMKGQKLLGMSRVLINLKAKRAC